MNNRFLISVATAALIAGTGLANAQGAGTSREAPSGGSATQQSAPSPDRGGASSGTMQRDSGGMQREGGGMKGSESGMKGADSADKAEPHSKSAQDSNRMQGEKSKSMHSETDSSKGGKDMKAEGQDSKTGATKAEGRDSKSGGMNAETKGSTDTKSQTTTGNAATAATAAPPAEKRTQIVSAIKSERIQETTNVNFNVSVGTVVPTGVRFHPLPPRIVEIYPEWRGYEVILVQGRYVIVRPQTHEIVYIIEG